jgi:hypothetical protein
MLPPFKYYRLKPLKLAVLGLKNTDIRITTITAATATNNGINANPISQSQEIAK